MVVAQSSVIASHSPDVSIDAIALRFKQVIVSGSAVAQDVEDRTTEFRDRFKQVIVSGSAITLPEEPSSRNNRGKTMC
jgi:hypothetical protein